MAMRTKIVSIALAFALGGCAEVEETDISWMRPNWEQLPDGSSWARVTKPDTENSLAIRCWPAQEDGFQCIRAATFGASGFQSIRIARDSETELPSMLFPVVLTDDGYSCGSLMGPSEEISRSGEALTSNRLEYGRSRWSSSFVQDYMARNNVGGTDWFPCLEVLDAVQAGSLATVGTSSVSDRMLGPA